PRRRSLHARRRQTRARRHGAALPRRRLDRARRRRLRRLAARRRRLPPGAARRPDADRRHRRARRRARGGGAVRRLYARPRRSRPVTLDSGGVGLAALIVPMIPGVIWLWIIYRTDWYEPEPKRLVRATCGRGIISSGPAFDDERL